MLRSRGIPDLTRKQPVPYRIQCLDRTHTYRKSTPDEWIVIVRPGCRPFWGILFRMLDVLAGHQIRLLFDANLVTLTLKVSVLLRRPRVCGDSAATKKVLPIDWARFRRRSKLRKLWFK